ncbi:MAG: DUF6503 family protein [Crocinitomicaceae bacterium]
MKNFLLIIPFVLLACGSDNDAKNEQIEQEQLSKSQSLINQMIEAHGGVLYEQAHYQFTFRDKVYTFKNNGSDYRYTSEHQTDQGWQKDTYENGKFERSQGDKILNLSTEAMGMYGETLNSVIYFATLPHKLSDPSVQSEYAGTRTIKGVEYEVVKVTFKQEGGGQDFQDEYCYWINSQTHIMDYFAYNYQVNDGGVRFRKAFNSRKVEGVLFQDYVNYAAEVGTPLQELPILFEKDSLEEVSRIELVDIQSLK